MRDRYAGQYAVRVDRDRYAGRMRDSMLARARSKYASCGTGLGTPRQTLQTGDFPHMNNLEPQNIPMPKTGRNRNNLRAQNIHIQNKS